MYTLYKLFKGEYTELSTPDNYSNIYSQLEDYREMIVKEGLTPSSILNKESYFFYYDNNDYLIQIKIGEGTY